jgi:hypothetical protein
MLEDFTLATFAERIGDTFRIDDDGLEFELIEATAGSAARPDATRTPFSIVFRGPPEPILPQQIYRFEHADLGAFDIFIVPIGLDGTGMQYEAVFG